MDEKTEQRLKLLSSNIIKMLVHEMVDILNNREVITISEILDAHFYPLSAICSNVLLNLHLVFKKSNNCDMPLSCIGENFISKMIMVFSEVEEQISTDGMTKN